ncbi:hypothetical protein [Tahibacter caeni]|uniref:hypothetical protein n=1 Tax=Tahibacter caeni TaxID=1453545 RepID=UPI00214927EB|nr:hypothetical protein [Tahibacter caeni]
MRIDPAGSHHESLTSSAGNALALIGCFDGSSSNLDAARQFFAKRKIGSSADHGIIRSGHPDDHAVTIHGLADDAASCKTIADALDADASRRPAASNAFFRIRALR